LSLHDLIQASTITPAGAIGWQDRLGRLEVGREADLAVLALEEGRFIFKDAERQSLGSDRRLRMRWTLRAGQVYPRLDQAV
jgi:dihydroorotase